MSFVGLTTVTADARLCTYGVAKVETHMPFWGWLLGVVTFGIVPAMRTEYHCAAPASLAERDALRAAQRNSEEAKRVAEAAQRKAEDEAKAAEAARRKAEEELDEVRRQLEAVRATSAAPQPTPVATNVAPSPDTSSTPASDAVQSPHSEGAACDPGSAAAALQGGVRPAAPDRVTLIEEAEVYAASRGVLLLCKTEHKEQIVAPRAYGYRTINGVRVSVIQFHTAKAASRYRQAFADVPLGAETHIQLGRILFSVWGATDAERQAVISALE
ncbi:hypothetical protein JQX13_50420 [Archangium violaceum]|uniref:hypothetical protein n=1 Tax=Archangium violaceum TaxID=83451 RepID=UPI00193B234D|nr:hypothetical protein [Archangium violaceum]QRK08083.1 hypothetical protein JQX13_50420 [Archangium violaceum]